MKGEKKVKGLDRYAEKFSVVSYYSINVFFKTTDHFETNHV